MFLFLKEQHERHFHLKFMYFCNVKLRKECNLLEMSVG